MSVNDDARRATYARASLKYDEEHEKALLQAITEAIFETSIVSDCNVCAIRTGEATEALLTIFSGKAVLAMSPSASRSPTAIRKTIDELGKRLRRKVGCRGGVRRAAGVPAEDVPRWWHGGGRMKRSTRRQIQKLAAKVDRISDADRKFFARFPHRKFRIRIAGQAERETQELAHGSLQNCPPGCRLFVIVQNIAPGTRMKIYTVGLDGMDTDLPENVVQRLWDETTASVSEKVQDVEAVLRKVAGGQS